jgi:hypothetical protein
MRETKLCPECNEECDRDEVDVEVGIIYGPWGCYSCGWSEYDRKRAEAENPGWYCDPTGGLHRIDAIVERCERFGLGEAARQAFEKTPEEQEPTP